MIAQSVVPMESGGRYDALGPVQQSGDRALGKYQVMASNVGSWTKQVLGKALTPQQFLNNPVAQDAVASIKMHEYYLKHGNAADAISSWFSGRPYAGNNSRDSIGTSVPHYVQAGLRELKKYATQ